MSLALLSSALCLSLESFVNGVIGLDPAARSRLQKLEGTCLAIHCTRPEWRVFISARAGRLAIASLREDPADASIRGPALSLLGLLVSRDKTKPFQDGQVDARGDAQLAQQWQKLFSNLDIDWEMHVARVFGDIPTQLLSDTLGSARRHAAATASSLRRDLDEYLHEEARLVPTLYELENFHRRVDDLRLRMDRAKARLDLLDHQKT
jgi:ubiquinone biosynthesis accessory factor UbiJ